MGAKVLGLAYSSEQNESLSIRIKAQEWGRRRDRRGKGTENEGRGQDTSEDCVRSLDFIPKLWEGNGGFCEDTKIIKF